MEHPSRPPRSIAEGAARARVEEMAGSYRRSIVTRQLRTTRTDRAEDRRLKEAVRRMWAKGDYHTFATSTIWEIGPRLVEACAVSRGERVLDVAAGSGNTALRAAQAGAIVTASDLTPENFAAGREEALRLEVELEWVEADAEALPFDDDEFDVVTSSFGAIFAFDHGRVAEEMTRVCRPGGRIGMVAFRPVGVASEFFEIVGRYAPPPPAHALPPLLWGREEHVRDLFGERVDRLEMTRSSYIERSTNGPAAYRDLFLTTFGPVIAIREGLASEPDRVAAFDAELLDFASSNDRGAPDGASEYPYEYLLIVARVNS